MRRLRVHATVRRTGARWARRSLAVGTALAVLPGIASLAAPASATIGTNELYARPANSTWVLEGRGYGHGHGMSQWGAYGAAAKLGKRYDQILAAYYPGTRRTTAAVQRTLRVWVSVDSDHELAVAPDPTGHLTATAGSARAVLPSTIGSARVTRWRVVKSGSSLRLQGLTGTTWRGQRLGGATTVRGPLTFSTSKGRVRVVLGSGSSAYLREYRGRVGAALDSGGTLRTVNTVATEDYLRSVVAWEMSPSWHREALKAQAVAARTYATYDAQTPSSVYDTCDSTMCQAYRGAGDYQLNGTRRSTYEWSNSDAAVKETAGQVLTYQGKVAVTQFGAANGGRSVAAAYASSYPYLPERNDPWDGLIPNSGHAWTVSVSASALQRAFPTVGTVKALRVLGRTGAGEFRGRVTSVRIEGSTGRTTVSGSSFRSALGLKSDWWRSHATPKPVLAAPDGVVSGTSARVSISRLLPRARATVQVLPRGAKTWTTAATVTGSASGTATASVPVRIWTHVRVVSGGVPSTARRIAGYVDPVLSLTSPARGEVRATVTITPRLGGIPVRISRIDADGSRTLLGTRRTGLTSRTATLTLAGQKSGSTVRLVARPVAGPDRAGRRGPQVAVRVR